MSGPTLEYEPSPSPRRRFALPWPATVAIVVVVLSLVASLFMPTLNRPREHPNWLRCSSNLKQIGQAMMLYANENRGQMPPDFARLIETQDVVPELFVCRSTDDERSTAATQPAQLRADLAPGAGHCSYRYVDGLGRYDALPADVVVAFEPLANHTDRGNVLFADGHTEYLAAPAIEAIERQFNLQVRPIRVPAGVKR